jgi:membrane-associated phospholipid phosphatase
VPFGLPACALLILFGDQPLAGFMHAHFGGAAPFFAALTATADRVHEALMTHVLGLPIIFLALGLAFAIGRYGLKRRGATLFLLLLLTHEFSMVLANALKGAVHRLRPEVQFGAGYEGSGLWAEGPHNDSFPSYHTAVYFSLFWPLAVAFPKYRGALLVLPVLVGLGRLVLGAHYLSDVWFSVWLVVALTFLFGRLERPRGIQAM